MQETLTEELSKSALAQKFNESAALREELSKLAAEAHAAFPQRFEKLVVATTNSYKTVFVAPKIANHLTNNTAIVEKALKEKIKEMQACNSKGLAIYYYLAGTLVNLIVIDENPHGIFSSKFTKKVKAVANFNHEIGHFAAKNGFSSGTVSEAHRAEVVADVYAALKDIQYYGKNTTDFFKYYSRAYTIVSNTSPVYYTDDAIQKVKQLSEEMDISNLSLNKTIELAEKIALEYSLNDKTLEKISTAFLPAKNAFKTVKIGEWNDDILKKCFKIIQENADDPDISKAGIRFLNRPDIKKRLESNAKTDIYWKDSLNFIENHQIKLSQKSTLQQYSNIAMKVH